jgi:hypothetical protein
MPHKQTLLGDFVTKEQQSCMSRTQTTTACNYVHLLQEHPRHTVQYKTVRHNMLLCYLWACCAKFGITPPQGACKSASTHTTKHAVASPPTPAGTTMQQQKPDTRRISVVTYVTCGPAVPNLAPLLPKEHATQPEWQSPRPVLCHHLLQLLLLCHRSCSLCRVLRAASQLLLVCCRQLLLQQWCSCMGACCCRCCCYVGWRVCCCSWPKRF